MSLFAVFVFRHRSRAAVAVAATTTTITATIAVATTTTTITFYDWWKLTKFPYRRSILLPLVRTLFIDLPVAFAEVAQPLIVTPF